MRDRVFVSFVCLLWSGYRRALRTEVVAVFCLLFSLFCGCGFFRSLLSGRGSWLHRRERTAVGRLCVRGAVGGLHFEFWSLMKLGSVAGG